MSTQTMQSTETIAKTLVERYNKGEVEWIFHNLYSQDIVSIEDMEMPGMPKEMHGLQAVLKKGEMWRNMNEIHSSHAEGPLVSDTEFSVMFSMDVTNKETNQRMQVKEIAVYRVADSKIVWEHFFYNTEKCA